jgi:hypothetical protein
MHQHLLSEDIHSPEFLSIQFKFVKQNRINYLIGKNEIVHLMYLSDGEIVREGRTRKRENTLKNFKDKRIVVTDGIFCDIP